jgi:hypothetical protein
MLSADVFNPLVASAFAGRLQQHGFVAVSDCRWTRPASQHIWNDFVLYRLKSLSRVPAWGFSLDFVPQVTKSRVRWKHAPHGPRPGLLYDPLDYTRDVREWSISPFDSEALVRKTAAAVAERAIPAALDYFQTVRDVPDLLDAFAAKRARPFVRFGFDNYVGEWLSYAFTHAWLHNAVEARQWLETFLGCYSVSEAVARKLRERLEDMIAA